MSSPYAFTLATHDPESGEKALIAGREFFTRRFTLLEANQALYSIRDAAKKAVEKKIPFTVDDELKAILPALNARIADGGAKITVKDLVGSLTEEEYRALLLHYAPSLVPKDGDPGKV